MGLLWELHGIFVNCLPQCLEDEDDYGLLLHTYSWIGKINIQLYSHLLDISLYFFSFLGKLYSVFTSQIDSFFLFDKIPTGAKFLLSCQLLQSFRYYAQVNHCFLLTNLSLTHLSRMGPKLVSRKGSLENRIQDGDVKGTRDDTQPYTHKSNPQKMSTSWGRGLEQKLGWLWVSHSCAQRPQNKENNKTRKKTRKHPTQNKKRAGFKASKF